MEIRRNGVVQAPLFAGETIEITGHLVKFTVEITPDGKLRVGTGQNHRILVSWADVSTVDIEFEDR